MSLQYFRYDLKAGTYGSGNFRDQPVESALMGHPPEYFDVLSTTINLVWDVIFPEWYVKLLEEALAKPII